MHVKNHMAMWFLWFLWFLRVEYSGNPLYKPLCAFLVFVVLVWFLCGRICGFWSRVVFGSGLRVRSTSCGFCGSVVLHSMPMPMPMPSVARPLGEGLCGSVVLPASSMPMIARRSCASTCSLWSAKKICPLPHFVLCSISSPLEATFTEWRKRSWLERP